MTVKPLHNRHVLITCGPTREYIDPVRYISNDSSGIMGAALARAALKSGARVTVICGPVTCKFPAAAKKIDVVSAEEMFSAVKKLFSKADIFISAAAVADFRPVKVATKKIKKDNSKKQILLKLVRNPDILAWAASRKNANQSVLGFALETEHLIDNARKKLFSKGCDAIAANMQSSIASKNTEIFFITSSLQTRISGTKEVVASKIVKQLTCFCK